MVQIVTSKKAGDTLKLSVYRQGQTLELTVTVAEQKQSAQAGSSDTQQSQQQDQSQQQQQGGGYNFPCTFSAMSPLWRAHDPLPAAISRRPAGGC